MKKLIALLLALLTLFTCVAATAETPYYSTTQQFLNILNEYGTKYTLIPASNSSENDHIRIGFNDCIFTANIFFDDENHVYFRLWSEETVTAGKNYALDVVNQLNRAYKWAKFVFDDDNTITVEWDGVLSNNCGEIVLEMLLRLLSEVTDSEILSQLNNLY